MTIYLSNILVFYVYLLHLFTGWKSTEDTSVKVLVVGGSPSKASYNGAAISGFQFNTTNTVLLSTCINADLISSFKIT